jgi:glycosyltransferase involved in cell wall biosynthesis
MAELTIGMPLYNNAATLDAALDSLLQQTFTDFRLVLSDDASRDATAEIAQHYAARDPRIEYIRQATNLGYHGNFGFLVARADTPFFMLAPGDDRWAPRFVEANIGALKRDPSLVGSISRVVFTSDPPIDASGTYPIDGDTARRRLAQYLAGCGVCDMSRNFAIYRTKAIQAAFPKLPSTWFDMVMCAELAVAGKINEVPEVLMMRDKSPPDVSLRLMHKSAPAGPRGWFPAWAATRWLLDRPRLPRSAKIFLGLAAFNIDWHFVYAERYLPRYAALTGGLRWLWRRQVGWRCRRALRR